MGPHDQLKPGSDGAPDQRLWPPAIRWKYRPADPRVEACRIALKGLPGDPGRLADCTVAVFGTGAVGGVAFAQLARLGIGNLIGIDPDDYGRDSWLTQPSLPAESGQPKAHVQGEAAHEINPSINVAVGIGCGQDVPLAILRRADLFIVAGDNLELPVWVGVLGAGLGKVVIQGAVHGESQTCLVRVFDRTDPESACPACQLSGSEWTRLGSRFGCDLATQPQGLEATRTLPTVCATAAQLVTTEALKWLSGTREQLLRNEELAYSLWSHRLWRTALPRNENCRCPHRRWRQVEVSQPAAEVSLSTLLDQLEPRTGKRRLAGLQVKSELPWISAAQCSGCGAVRQLYRFDRLGKNLGRCDCGGWFNGDRAGVRSVVPASDLETCLDRSLADLGLTPGSALGIGRDGDWTYFFLADGDLAELIGSPQQP